MAGEITSIEVENETYAVRDTSKVSKITSTNKAATRFNGNTGELQNSQVVIEDDGSIEIPSGANLTFRSSSDFGIINMPGNGTYVAIKTATGNGRCDIRINNERIKTHSYDGQTTYLQEFPLYSGTLTTEEWVTSHPSAVWGNITGTLSSQGDLMSALGLKEDTTNKVALGSGNTVNQYPNAKSVWDECRNIREVAEGKCKAFTVSYNDTDINAESLQYASLYKLDGTSMTHQEAVAYVDGLTNGNSVFNSQDTTIDIYDFDKYYIFRIQYYLRYIIAKGSELLGGIYFNVGDIFLVFEVDVPDRWVSDIIGCGLSKMETSKVDIDSKVSKSGDTMTGNLTFGENNKLIFDTWNISEDSDTVLSFMYGSSDCAVFMDSTYCRIRRHLLPRGTDVTPKDLGASNAKWHDLYLDHSAYIGNWAINDLGYGQFKYGNDIVFEVGSAGKMYIKQGLVTDWENIDIGSSASTTFRNLYLSGGVYLPDGLVIKKDATTGRLGLGNPSTGNGIGSYGHILSLNSNACLGLSDYRFKNIYISGSVYSSLDFTCQLPIPDSYDNLDIKNFGSNLVIKDNIMYITLNIRLDNQTESPISFNGMELGFTTSELPNTIRARIKDIKGELCSDVGDPYAYICGEWGSFQKKNDCGVVSVANNNVFVGLARSWDGSNINFRLNPEWGNVTLQSGECVYYAGTVIKNLNY